MEFRLHVVIYTLEGEDRFKVMAGTPEGEEQVDVTEHYEVIAIKTEDGRAGFAVLPKSLPPVPPPDKILKGSEGG